MVKSVCPSHTSRPVAPHGFRRLAHLNLYPQLQLVLFVLREFASLCFYEANDTIACA